MAAGEIRSLHFCEVFAYGTVEATGKTLGILVDGGAVFNGEMPTSLLLAIA
jgi:hypothetical protein